MLTPLIVIRRRDDTFRRLDLTMKAHDTPCRYCQGTLVKASDGMYQCEDCGRGVAAKYVE